MPVVPITHGVVPGSSAEKVRDDIVVDISNAEVQALQTTAKVLVPAVAGFVPVYEGMVLQKAAGAYTAVAAGDDLEVRYADASGTQVGGVAGVSFLDQADAQETWVRPYAAGANATSYAAQASDLVLALGGAVTGADGGVLKMRVTYRLVPVA